MEKDLLNEMMNKQEISKRNLEIDEQKQKEIQITEEQFTEEQLEPHEIEADIEETISNNTIKIIKTIVLPNMNIDEITKRNLSDIIDYLECQKTCLDKDLSCCEDGAEIELKQLNLDNLKYAITELNEQDVLKIDFEELNEKVFSKK